MGTDKRARQKELHRSRADEARRAADAQKRRQRVLRIGFVIVAGVLASLAMALLTNNKESDSEASTSSTTAAQATSTSAPAKSAATLTGPGAGASITTATPCPAADGSSPRTTSFAKAPPTCIESGVTYSATFSTSKGEFVATLDSGGAPTTVNNFIVLARYHFYDGIPFHRIVPDFVIQAGDPSDTPNGTGGPGYTITEEPPADGTYAKYDLAMAKTAAPKSTGSQFFIVTGDPAGLNATPTYSLFGKVTSGTEVVDAIAAVPVIGDAPTEAVTINSVTITQK